MYPKMNLSQSHGTSVASEPQRACPTSAGLFLSCQDTHLHIAIIQLFIQSDACCPPISLSAYSAQCAADSENKCYRVNVLD